LATHASVGDVAGEASARLFGTMRTVAITATDRRARGTERGIIDKVLTLDAIEGRALPARPPLVVGPEPDVREGNPG
jgi:hypothetical protein